MLKKNSGFSFVYDNMAYKEIFFSLFSAYQPNGIMDLAVQPMDVIPLRTQVPLRKATISVFKIFWKHVGTLIMRAYTLRVTQFLYLPDPIWKPGKISFSILTQAVRTVNLYLVTKKQ